MTSLIQNQFSMGDFIANLKNGPIDLTAKWLTGKRRQFLLLIFHSTKNILASAFVSNSVLDTEITKVSKI